MPAENRILTINTDRGLRRLDPTETNTLQDSVVMAQEASAEEDGLPANFVGARRVYGEFTVANGTNVILDRPVNYWRNAAYDYRHRHCVIDLCTVAVAGNLPSGANHTPDDATAYYSSFNTKGGDPIGGGFTQAWNPVGSLYIYADSTTGNLYASATAATYYIYIDAMFTTNITTEVYGDHRQKSFADYATVTTDFLTHYQDEAIMLEELSGEQDGLPATLLGGTWIYGEFTVPTATLQNIDTSRDWKHATAYMFYCDVAAGNNRLPSGANHSPGNIQNINRMCWNLKNGYAAAGPWPPVGVSAVWSPVANVWIFSDAGTGSLRLRNNTGANLEFYVAMLLTSDIR
jgi:hypothetical protein